MKRTGLIGILVAACMALTPTGAAASLDITEWDGALPIDGTSGIVAGSHPESITTTFDFGTHVNNAGNVVPDAGVRNLVVDTPAGFVGAPNATPTCKGAAELSVDFDHASRCAPDTIVGTVVLRWSHGGPTPTVLSVPVYNMRPPPGVPAQFGINVVGFIQLFTASVRADGDYGVNINLKNISQGISTIGATTTFWGVPGDPSHDNQRCRSYGGEWGAQSLCLGSPGDPEFGPNAFSSGVVKPLLTNPTSCAPPGAPLAFGLNVESWEQPPTTDSAVFHTHLAPPNQATPVGVIGCDRVPFSPDITVQPGTKQADSPTGLEVKLRVPTAGLENPTGIAQSALKKAVVSLPEGMTVNPSYADGVDVCSPDQIGLTSVNPARFDLAPATCSDASKIGDVRIDTPLLDTPLEGGLFAAESNDPEKAGHENPFDSLVPLYIVAEGVGVRVKLAGDVALDERTGQIVTTFDNNPQIPFSVFTLNFKGGPRAPLVNPSTCGTFTSTAEFSPWARPDQPVSDSDPFTITSGPGGGPCATATSNRPFHPALKAGTLNSNAGSFSPFVLRMSRNDGEQEITSFSSDLPPGLVGKLAGVTECPDAALAAAEAKTGKSEKATPSCPAASRIGTALTGSGSGQILTYVPGNVYLAGPYRGAPLSVATVVPAAVGPFDVGTIVVRAALRIDPDDAQVHVDPVPIPYIRQGIALHVRDIRVILDRRNFTLNPTNCDPMEIAAQMHGTGADFANSGDDSTANLSNRFQVANCAALGFKPKLSFKLRGGTHRGDYPALSATLTARPGDANIAKTAVTLPHSVFLAQEHIRTICTRVQFAAKQCPAGSIYGFARATSPLIDGALQGPVYLRSSSNPLPDLVADLNGRFEVVLAGRIDSVNEGIRNTFDVIPDAPVTKFTLSMKGGRKSLLVNSRNLCKSPSRAEVRMVGQNGKRLHTRPLVADGCSEAAHKHKRR